MLKLKNVLHPTDFSQASAIAYGYAESVAGHYGAKPFTIHVTQDPFVWHPDYVFVGEVEAVSRRLLAHAEREFAEFMKDRGCHAKQHGIQAECKLLEGHVPGEILNFAQKNAIDLIVMATHGRNTEDRRTLGSVTEKVLRKACCPVLAVRKPEHSFVSPGDSADAVNLRKILYCTDFSKDSNRAADYAFSLAMEFGAEITLLHVIEDVPDSKDAQSAMTEVKTRLNTLIPKEAGGRCTSPVKVRIGRPYQEISQLAVEDQTDLIVLGVRGRNIVDLALFGSTTYRVIQLGPCPVLSVHI